MRWLDSITDSMDMNLGEFQEMVRNREAWLQSMGLQRCGHHFATEQQDCRGVVCVLSPPSSLYQSPWEGLHGRVHQRLLNESEMQFLNIYFYFLYYLFGCAQSQLHHTESFSCSVWDLVPQPGLKSSPLELGTWSLSHQDHQGSPKKCIFISCMPNMFGYSLQPLRLLFSSVQLLSCVRLFATP